MSSETRNQTWPWWLLALLILVQYLLFRQFVLRELVWSYPWAHDQTVYLDKVYECFGRMERDGPWSAVLWLMGTETGNGVLLPSLSALGLLVFGAGRLGALTTPFLIMALFQAALVDSLRRATGKWWPAFAGLGLFLATQSRFIDIGGFYDFRFDFATSCLYGVAACLLIREGLFRSRVWSLAFGFVCGLVMIMRFVALTYIFLALGLMGAYLLLRDRTRLANLFLAWGTGFAMVLPFLIRNRRNVWEYYVVGHVLSIEKEIRAVEARVGSLLDVLAYYPRSLLFHLGQAWEVVVLAALAAAAAWWLLRRGESGRSRLDAEAAAAMLSWVLCPMILYTADASKSPVVVGLVVGPVVIAATLCMAWLLRTPGGGRAGTVIATAVVTAGMAFTISRSAGRIGMLPPKHEAVELMAAYDEISQFAARHRTSILMTSDTLAEYVDPHTFRVIVLERTGAYMAIRPYMSPTIFSVARKDFFEAFQQSNVVVVTEKPPGLELSSPFPFYASVRPWRAELKAIAESDFELVRKLRMGSHVFSLYQRYPVEVEGDSAGWITAAGATLLVETPRLLKRPVVVVRGTTLGEKLLNYRLEVEARLLDTSAPPVHAQTKFDGPRYEFRLDFSGQTPPRGAVTRISLKFDKYFVPKDAFRNNDTRKLVLMRPKTVILMARPAPFE